MKGTSLQILIVSVWVGFTSLAFAQTPVESYVRPNSLKAGDTVAIVAPAGILKNRQASIQEATVVFSSWGLHVVLGKHLYAKDNHFAGTDEQRAEDFQKAMDDTSVKAIWCARGGYGTMRILDMLDYSNFKKNPKWIVGFSDITAIHGKLHQLCIQSVHGMMPTGVEGQKMQSESTIKNLESLKKVLFGEALKYQVPSSFYNRMGKASGQLIGGNLSLLQACLQSDATLDTKDKILFIEEIGEYRYSIDRMLFSLKRAGYFKQLKGLIIGDISRIKVNTTPFGKSNEEIVLNVVKEYDFPVLFDFPAGHEKDNRALILGREVTLEVGEKESTLTFKN
ncbi:MAG: LD-carboxypeptidase [Bacteroidota bacterium]